MITKALKTIVNIYYYNKSFWRWHAKRIFIVRCDGWSLVISVENCLNGAVHAHA